MLNKRKFYINGQWVDPIKKNDFEVINPCNEDPFAIISLGSKEDTDLTVNESLQIPQHATNPPVTGSAGEVWYNTAEEKLYFTSSKQDIFL